MKTNQATNRLLAGALKAEVARKTPRPEPEGPWEMSGPEAGDGDETVLVCGYDTPHYEVIEITEGTLAKRKEIARKIARLLNEGKGRLL